jgi:hypothetical protein
MKTKMHLVLALSALLACAGCFSPDYKKIPLQTNEIPYILADGDYVDNKGKVHTDQHNVWAMSQADVFDYMSYIRKNGPIQNPASSRMDSIKGFFTKTRVIIMLSITTVLFLVAFILERRKRKEKVD